MNSVKVIETALQLSELIDHLSNAQHIAVDTESNSFYAYSERICLIQISTSECDFIIDPLSLNDLEPVEIPNCTLSPFGQNL